MYRAVAILTLTAVIWVALFAAQEVNAGGGCHRTGITESRGPSVGLTQRCFEPTVIRVQPGDRVTWTNRDPQAHTVTGVANTWGTYDQVLEGQSVSYRFEKSGVFPYFCMLHPSMVGAVVVGDGSAATALSLDGAAKAVSAKAPWNQGQPDTNQLSSASSAGGTLDELVIAGIVLFAVVVAAGVAMVVLKRSAR